MANFKLIDEPDFELAHIFECGQCFRWKKEQDESYTGVTKFGVMNVKMEKNDVIINGEFVKDSTQIEDEKYIKACINDYFDLNTDYSSIQKVISKDDINMKEAIKFGYGIRILNQDPWEMLISYIISAANNIPRISRTVENISSAYGKKVTFNGRNYYLFPAPNELAEASVEDLRELNLGFRDKYVHNATQLIVNREINLYNKVEGYYFVKDGEFNNKSTQKYREC